MIIILADENYDLVVCSEAFGIDHFARVIDHLRRLTKRAREPNRISRIDSLGEGGDLACLPRKVVNFLSGHRISFGWLRRRHFLPYYEIEI